MNILKNKQASSLFKKITYKKYRQKAIFLVKNHKKAINMKIRRKVYKNKFFNHEYLQKINFFKVIKKTFNISNLNLTIKIFMILN
jgi:hypothetical protein